MNEPRIQEMADLICDPFTSNAKRRELIQLAFELGVCHGRLEGAENLVSVFKQAQSITA
jgi:hypothetical protein